MGAIKELYLLILDSLEERGRADRATPELLPTDQKLLDIALTLGGGELLHPTVDENDPLVITDLRDAYNTGWRPDLLDFHQVARSLGDLGVPAHVLHTSGGTATLYAGVADERCEDDDPRRWPVSLGPGDWCGHDATGLLDEISYGVPGGESHHIEMGQTPAGVAKAIAALIGEA